MNEELEAFKTAYAQIMRLIDELENARLVECIMLMALHISQYVRREGDIPLSEFVDMVRTSPINQAHATC